MKKLCRVMLVFAVLSNPNYTFGLKKNELPQHSTIIFSVKNPSVVCFEDSSKSRKLVERHRVGPKIRFADVSELRSIRSIGKNERKLQKLLKQRTSSPEIARLRKEIVQLKRLLDLLRLCLAVSDPADMDPPTNVPDSPPEPPVSDHPAGDPSPNPDSPSSEATPGVTPSPVPPMDVPDGPSAECGNGILEMGEYCDDGNRSNLDGCNSSCFAEEGYHCSGQPSSCSLGEWRAPVGIPVPPFGIEESHRMYEGQLYNFGTEIAPDWQPYRNSGFGPYTHYIDFTHPAATNSSNPFGTPDRPRRTPPENLPAGSVVELHGGPYLVGARGGNFQVIRSFGTVDRPVFFRGASSAQRAVFQGVSLRMKGSYLIVENVVSNLGIGSHFDANEGPGDNRFMSLRASEVSGIAPRAGGAAVGGSGSHYMTIYNNLIHHNGSRDYYTENDVHGVVAGNGTRYLWIVDNHIYEQGGDSIQIHSTASSIEDWAQPVFIGRNRMHSNGENAVDLKQCRNVVISENEMYDFRPTDFMRSGSDGAALVVHYDPENIWIINNRIYDSSVGIRANGVGPGGGLYIIGNLIHNIHRSRLEHDTRSIGRAANAILLWADPEVHIINNTITDVDAGVGSVNPYQRHYILNNIVSNLAEVSHHIAVGDDGTALQSAMRNNLLFQPAVDPVSNVRVKWGSSTAMTLEQVRLNYSEHSDGTFIADPLFVNAPNFCRNMQVFQTTINDGVLSEIDPGDGRLRTTITSPTFNFEGAGIRAGDYAHLLSGTTSLGCYSTSSSVQYSNCYYKRIESVSGNRITLRYDITNSNAAGIQVVIGHYPITNFEIYVPDLNGFAEGDYIELGNDDIPRQIAAIQVDSLGPKLILTERTRTASSIRPFKSVCNWKLNPNVVEDYRLRSSSPAINAVPLPQVFERFHSMFGLDISKDLNGVSRANGGRTDLGAFEY